MGRAIGPAPCRSDGETHRHAHRGRWVSQVLNPSYEVTTTPRVHDGAYSGNARDLQELSWREGVAGRQSQGRGRRDPRDLRRERRRQVDADEGAERGLSLRLL